MTTSGTSFYRCQTLRAEFERSVGVGFRGSLYGTGRSASRLLGPRSGKFQNGRVELTRLPRLTTLEALVSRGRAVAAMIDAFQGDELRLTRMVPINDSRDQSMIILIRNIIGLAPDRQGVPGE